MYALQLIGLFDLEPTPRPALANEQIRFGKSGLIGGAFVAEYHL